jgi:hypothetical protein
LWFNILAGYRHTPRQQVIWNEYFRENDEKKFERYISTTNVILGGVLCREGSMHSLGASAVTASA